ncbi:MAG: DUF2273 domain-containing protein [Dictyoglomaceae bacterium]
MSWKEYKGRIIGTLLGIVLAISFLTLGFWKTIFWILLALLGFAIGSTIDHKERLNDLWDKLREIFINIGKER